MTFGVFVHRADSIYDDRPAERYQFPSQYLKRASQFVGDWIVYYEPRKVRKTRGYFAIAKVEQIVPDPSSAGMYLALIAPGSYLDFAAPVGFSGPDGVVEQGLLNEDGRISGRAQSAVRPIAGADFGRIVRLGLGEDTVSLPRVDAPASGLSEASEPFVPEAERLRVDALGSRILRDRVFRQAVLRAYDSRCALTGLRLINGRGRAEVEAAHIRPVEKNGPDIVSNGIALSGTLHWMFDRGLVGLSDDLQILVSRQVNDPESVRAMLNKDMRARPPSLPAEHPHPQFLHWHRTNCFKH